jgi:hypothetical protein
LHELGDISPEGFAKVARIKAESCRAHLMNALTLTSEKREANMNNQTALVLGLIIIGFFVVDYFYLEWDAPIFIGKKFLVLIDKMAFWR